MRRQEMVQLDRTDYIFDESGGRGTPASTFFKRLASSHRDRDRDRDRDQDEDSGITPFGDASNTVGSPGLDQDNKIVGSSFSHADALSEALRKERAATTPESGPHGSHGHGRKGSYFDRDDDWDANIEHDLVRSGRIAKAIENRPSSAASGHGSSGGGGAGNAGGRSSNDGGRAVDQLYTSGGRNGLKMQFDGIMRDPSSSLYSIAHGSSRSVDSVADSKTSSEIEQINSRLSRINRFKKVLQASTVDLQQLRKLAWSGIPDELRPMSWQLLLGYLPTNAERRVSTLARKRQEYLDGVAQVFSTGLDQAMWHQISIDVPRTNPHIKLYSFVTTQRALERILYLWAIRHPASGYVQGINDLVTPFFQTFLSAYIDSDPEGFDPGQLPKQVIDVVEADSYWCLTKLLDGIQDNYIHAQPGIQRQVAELHDLTQRIDSNLVKHFQREAVEFMQFSFRWMNCLLMREISVKNTIRMWDTYMAEGAHGFSQFHVYVCAAFLVKWSGQLQTMEFQEIMMFLQALPTKDWGEKDMELLLSEAFMWQSLFKNAAAHLR